VEEQEIGLMNDRTVIATHSGRHLNTADPGLFLLHQRRSISKKQ